MTYPCKVKPRHLRTATLYGKAFSDIRTLTNPRGALAWYNAPEQGLRGSWKIVSNQDNNESSALLVCPPAKKDYWRKTYYEPRIVKDDGPFLYYASSRLSTQQHHTVPFRPLLTEQRTNNLIKPES